jgi:hypothetical protein
MPAQSAQIVNHRIDPMNPEKASPPTGPADSADKNPMQPGTAMHHAAPTGLAAGNRPIAGPSSAEAPAQSAQIVNRRIDPMNPERALFPPPTRPRGRPLTYVTPTKAQALRTTTLPNTWHPDLRSQLAAKFGPRSKT